MTFFSLRAHGRSLAASVVWCAGFAWVLPAAGQAIFSNASNDASVPALATSTRSISGVNAPAGGLWSETPGTTMEANIEAGFSCFGEPAGGAYRIADDFTVTAEYGWRISTLVFYVYQPKYTGTASPVSAVNLRVWDGPPGAPGSMVLYGDGVQNRLAGAVRTSTYRIFNTRSLPNTSSTSTTRRLWEVSVRLDDTLFPPATYWCDVQMQSANPDAALYVVPASITGQRAIVGANAMIYAPSGLGSSWMPIVDDGKPFLSPDVAQDIAFRVTGEMVNVACPADFNADGGIDGADVQDFFRAWSQGDSAADVNGDGGVDGSDVGVFFDAWSAGGC